MAGSVYIKERISIDTNDITSDFILQCMQCGISHKSVTNSYVHRFHHSFRTFLILQINQRLFYPSIDQNYRVISSRKH